MEKRCPRCGKAFLCLHDRIEECPCTGVSLSAEVREYIARNYSQCLCRDCLEEINRKVTRKKSQKK